MFSNIRCEWTLTVGIVIVTFLAATRQTNAQIYLLNYSEDRVNARLADKKIELRNVTDITEVYTINGSPRIPSEISQSTMDAITITWYVATFLALLAFFSLMACSDRKCGRRNVTPLDDNLQQPPSPAPSYSEFAPPSYETVIEKYYLPATTKVFVVQVPYIENEKDKDPPPPFSFHTINELQKLSC